MSTSASAIPIWDTGSTYGELPGTVSLRSQAPLPAGYAVFDCETTGTDPRVDEIVSLAILRLDADGAEASRYSRLVRPGRPIPAEATAVHGIGDEDVVAAPAFEEVAGAVCDLLACDTLSQGLAAPVVFVAHNVSFDLPVVQAALARAGVDYRPTATACTLEAFRLLDPLAENHRLTTICARRGIAIHDPHEALADVLATAALLRLLLSEGLAPETVRLDQVAYMRLRSRGDTRPASQRQVRRVFGLARSAGLLGVDGAVDREAVAALVERVAGRGDVDALTREQVQDVFDALERLIDARPHEVREAV